ncbi:MAG: hypothetical protein ACREM2_01675 [Vulcanimicrobiaceae bacterium]
MFAWLVACSLMFFALNSCSGGGGASRTASAGTLDVRRTDGSSPSGPATTRAGSAAGVGAGQIRYNLTQACIDHRTYTNSGLPKTGAAPHGEGEFDLDGLDRSYWGGIRTRQDPVPNSGNSWGPGFEASFGRYQYDTYFGDSSDGSGNDPFYVGRDTAVAGSPKGVRIEAIPMPSSMKDNPTFGGGYTASNTTATTISPAAGGTFAIPVARPDAVQQGWKVGIGRPAKTGGSPKDDPQGVVFLGTVTAGGCMVSSSTGACTGGTKTLVISGVHYFEGGPGVTIPSGTDVQAWDFPNYYSGVLDTDITQEYGFFVARLRLPQPKPALSPAWWILESGGVGENPPKSGPGHLTRSEWDIEEMFANDYGYNLNAGNILWNSSSSGPWHSYGCGLNCSNPPTAKATGVYPWPSTETANFNQAYHDYGLLVSPGGPSFPSVASRGGVFTENGNPYRGTTFYLDGNPIPGHVGGPDLTQGSGDKELMAMFQVAAPGTFLDGKGQGLSDPFPEYDWVQWIRAYVPTGGAC